MKFATSVWLIGFVLAAGAPGGLAGTGGTEQEPEIRLDPQWRAPFSGRRASIDVAIAGGHSRTTTLTWELSVAAAVTARGEMPVGTSTPQVVKVEFDVPAIRPDAVLDAALRLQLSDPDSAAVLARVERRFPLLGEHPFTGREAWLRTLRMVLFDPEGRTADTLASAGIPCIVTRNSESLPALQPGLLLIAEGLSLRERPTLAAVLRHAFERGIPTLCLAPVEGEFHIPISGPGESDLSHVRLADRYIAEELDKRLGARAWGPDGAPVLGCVVLRGSDHGLRAVFESSGGWPWVEVRSRSGVVLVFCGFNIIRQWEQTPAARWLLMRLLEKMAPPERQRDRT